MVYGNGHPKTLTPEHPVTISRSSLGRIGVLTLAALSLAACGESTAPMKVSPEQLQSMGEAIAAEMESGVMQLTAQDVMSNTGGAPTFSRLPSSAGMMTRGPAFSRFASSAASELDCGVPSENPPTDTDGDKVPDNFTVTFALPACHFADQQSSIDVTGALRISDPQPGTSGMALSFSLDNFRLAFSGTDGSGVLLRDGSASVSASAGGLSQTQDWTEAAEITGVQTATASVNWTASFAAAQGQTITPGQPLPDGAYLANGSVGYEAGNRSASFSVTTLTALQYSAACAAGMADGSALTPFTAGKIRVAVTGQDGAGYVEVTYFACNAATVVVAAQ